MAKGVGFEGANAVFRAPEGVPQEECYDLQVFVDRDAPQIISCWRLSEEELQLVIQTGVVWLSVSGRVLPPVLVSGTALVSITEDDRARPARAEPALPIAPRTSG